MSTSRKSDATTKTRIGTHISRLALDYTIQMVNPYDLKAAMDLSTDHPDGTPHDSRFVTLLQKKYGNCSDWFLANLEVEGIKEPLVMIILPDGRWQFDDGHHRLMWALLNNVDVPVVFDDRMTVEDDILDNTTCYEVARHHITARHDTTPEELALVVETESYLTNIAEAATGEFTTPLPRHRAKAKDGGKHRAT